MADHTHNPYVGPRTFEEGDANIFFGRDREARDLLSLVISEPLVLFYAQSGAGKSSLINTRLIPGLREEGFVILPVARVGGELPQDIGEVQNVFAFNLLLSLCVGQDVDTGQLTQTTISDYLEARKEEDLASYQPPDDDDFWVEEEPARVLVIDQFEEIITTHLSRWTEREAFFEQLSEAIRNDPLLWVVLSLREDFVAALDPHARTLPGRLRARFHMERMGASAARQAVEKPAQKYGRPFAPGVAKTLVDNLRQIRTQEHDKVLLGQYIEPVQLQVVCYQLWQNLKDRPPAPITQEDVNELGNVDAALSQFYEQAIANVLHQTGVSELELRNWFDRQLITEAETRGTVYQGKEDTAGLENSVVQRLANQFLLRAEIRAGGTWYELVHDRFVSPILHANQAWRLQQSPLIRAAEEWDRAGRPRNKLYQGEQLMEALAGVKRESLEPIVQRFLTASEDAQSQRDLAKTRVEMEEQRQRAESEARTARRLRRLTVALVVIFFVAVGTAFYAISEAGRASENERIARENAAEAEANFQLAATREHEAQINLEAAATSAAEAQMNAQLAAENEAIAATRAAEAEEARAQAEASEAEAERNAELAEENAARAERLSRTSLAQSLASTAPRLVDRTNNTELATLLAVEAYHINRELNIELLETVDDSLREILARSYFNVVLEGHEGFVHQIAFSSDGALLATGDNMGGLFLWDLIQPDIPPLPLEGHETAVSAVVFSQDDRWLATADQSGLILLWDLNSRTPIRLEAHQGAVGQLAFTESDLISAAEDKNVFRWSLAAITGEEEATPTRIPGFNRNHQFVTLSPDGTILVTVNQLNTVSLWDLTAPGVVQEILFFYGNVPDITSVAFSADMTTLAAAGAEGIIRIWDLTRASTVPARIEAPAGVSQIALSPDGRMLASISGELSDLDVRLWNLSFFVDEGRIVPNEGISTQLKGHTSNIRALALSLDGLRMATGGDDKTVRLWHLDTGAAAPLSLEGNGFGVTSVAVDPDENLMMMGNEDGEILVWNTVTFGQVPEEPLTIFNGHDGPIHSLIVSSDGQTLISAGDDGLVNLWSLNPVDEVPQFTLNASQEPVYAIAVSPDGRFLVSGGEDGIIRFWPLADILAGGEITATSLMVHEDWVDGLAFSPDGRTLASGGGETAVFLWNLGQIEDMSALSTLIPTRLSGHEDAISSVAFSPNGHYLASGSYDTSVRLWDMERLDAPPINLFGHNDFVYDVIFSPDGNTLASSSWDRTINFWDVQAVTGGRPAVAPTTLRGHTGQVVDLTYNGDGQLLFSASLDGTARVWNAEVDGFIILACRQVHRNLSWEEWERYLEGDRYDLPCPDLPVHPSYIESARELARMQNIEEAVARFERAIELGAELDFDPETEARTLAVEGIVDNGLRRAEQGDLRAAVAAFVEAQNVDDSVAISGEEWQQLCSLGHEWNETAVVLDACQTAVDLAVESDDIALNQSLCLLATAPELVNTMAPACGRLAELAANSEDAYLAFQVCQLRDTISTLSTVVAPVCDLAASQTHTITVGMTAEGFIAAGQGELWSFEGSEGQQVTIGLTAVAASLDPYLILYGPDGAVIDENDDIDPGVITDSQLEDIVLPATGSYIIVARGFDETSVGAYSISLE